MKDFPSEPLVDFGTLISSASGLSPDSHIDDISLLLKTAATLELKPLQADKLLSIVNDRTKKALKPLRQELEFHKKEIRLDAPDPVLVIARATLAARFSDGGHLLHGKDGRFWSYRGSHWRPMMREEIAAAALEVANEPLYASSNAVSLSHQAARAVAIIVEPTDDPMGFAEDPPPVINCANGELWIEESGSIELRPHAPQSRQAYCLPFPFDPKADCPRFDAALEDIFSKAEDPQGMVRHFLEFAGHAIQPKRDIPAFWLLIGHGANGKSKLLETIVRCTADDAVSHQSALNLKKDRYARASLAGKQLVIDDDMTENTDLPDGLIKAISERKLMTARHPYGRSFSFLCRAMPVMAGNTYPRTVDVSFGMMRRAQVIPFARKFTGAEDMPKLFPEIWENEMPGVLNQFLEGLQRLRQRGHFDPPVDSRKAFDEFMAHANPLIGFLQEFCTEDPEGRIKLADFWAALIGWCKAQGVRISFGRNGLKRKLEGLNCTIKRVDGRSTLSWKPEHNAQFGAQCSRCACR